MAPKSGSPISCEIGYEESLAKPPEPPMTCLQTLVFPTKPTVTIRLESKTWLRIQFRYSDTEITGAWTDSQIESPTCHENQGRFCHDPYYKTLLRLRKPQLHPSCLAQIIERRTVRIAVVGSRCHRSNRPRRFRIVLRIWRGRFSLPSNHWCEFGIRLLWTRRSSLRHR